MTSEDPRQAGGDQGEGAANPAGQGGPPPVGRVRASASVPLPTRTPGAGPTEEEQAQPPAEAGRPGPFPPAGPTPGAAPPAPSAYPAPPAPQTYQAPPPPQN